ncbi:PQQ-dependent sugar dehydrogenase [Chitinophaga sp.]|uniref:PQQ-dependent sugar dehydrogenase n=1 Tax=Chitinophaga sp. TaxID=1869181 RepID=UPI0031DDBA5A
MLRNYLLPVVLLVLLASCSGPKKKMLYYAHQPEDTLAAQLTRIAASHGYTAVVTGNAAYLQTDSLAMFNLVCMPVSALNGLNHIAVPELKRYLEAGGGLLAIKDTALALPGYPWLQALDTVTGARRQDNGTVYVLPQPVSEQQLNEAWTAAGRPDMRRATTLPVPDSARYTRTVLAQGFDEPMEMAVLPGGDVLFIERKGAVKLYDHTSGQVKTIASFSVFSGIEDGLLGMTPDPGYEKNHYIYFYYAVPGEKAINRLSRFELKDGNLQQASEKILLEVPTQRRYCCHSAGYLKFDTKGLLYLSTGDNTNAEETDGYTPVDERPGRHLSDVQATSANTDDLRGKILRIRPEPNGTYSIPDGNLFPKDGSKGRPEIYVMGSRNPYRFSIDAETGYLYWGDVGPDTKIRGEDGELMSYDEINQAKQPGFYGWPYFLGNNQAFPLYNYANKELRPKKDPARPLNVSPNNTGLQELPPAQPAMIWYGKSASRYFPLVGKGGASAMAGPVFYSKAFEKAPYRLSPYYNGKLLIYEWIRGWMMFITFDEKGNYLRMEPFLPHIKFEAPVDVQFAPDGSLYVLEYGSNWFSKNTNSKLVRITFKEGNRDPVAAISADRLNGAAPLTVQLSAAGSRDFDKGDKLSFQWKIGEQTAEGETATHTFDKPGVYAVALAVKDGKGGEGRATLQLNVGNTPPVVKIQTPANRTFYWDNAPLEYQVAVTDAEDKVISPDQLQISFGFLPDGRDAAVVLAQGGTGNVKHLAGQQLLNSLDCKACHSMKDASIGPAYTAVAERYAGKGHEVAQTLAGKIIKGGSGNWGTREMSAHPDMQPADALAIVQYILSLSEQPAALPATGTLVLKEHIGKSPEGRYLLNARYTDKGANGVPPLSGSTYLLLRNQLIEAEDFDEGNVKTSTITTQFLTFAANVRNNSYARFNDIDLNGIKHIKCRVKGLEGGTIAFHIDAANGPEVARATVPGGMKEWQEITVPVSSLPGMHPLYLVFTGAADKPLLHLDRLYFDHR